MLVLCTVRLAACLCRFRVLLLIDCEGGESMSRCLSAWDWSLLVDYIVDVVFVVDTALRACVFAFTKFEGEQHVVVTDMADIFAKFKASKQWYQSVLGVLPLDVFAAWTGYLICWR